MTSPSQTSTRSLYLICLVVIALGLLAAAVALAGRIRAEASSKAVDIVIEYKEMVGLSGLEGVPLQTVLERMKGAGATAVALQEETIGDLGSIGQVVFVPFKHEFLNGDRGPHEDRPVEINYNFTLCSSSPDAYRLIKEGLQRGYPTGSWRSKNERFFIHGDPDEVRELGLGLDPAKVKEIKAADLRVMPRLTGGAGVSSRSLAASLDAVSQQIGGGGVLVFDGTMIPGYRTLLRQLAGELKKNNLTYGAIEFGKQKGDGALGAQLDGQLVRVHSISVDEMSNLMPQQAIQRFGLAVKDRNIRVLYVHLPPVSSESAGSRAEHPKLESAARYIYSINQEIAGAGFTPAVSGPAHPFTPLAVPKPLLALIFAGAAAGFLLWVLSVLPVELPRGYVTIGYAILALGMLAAVAFGLLPQFASLGRLKFGLLAATGFPLLALTRAYRKIDRLPEERLSPLLSGIGALVTATLITLGGGLLIAAMMSESRFLVKVGQFTGVKVALALPLLIFGALIVTDGVAKAGEGWVDYTARVRARLREFLWKPVYLWGIIVAAVALAVVALLLARSGNEGVGVSGLELKFRSVLEQVLVARPRTKEFAFGHPLFLFAIIAGARGQRALALALLLGAAIGQVDVLNTYCHAHTPVLLSLLRTANGLWLGIGIGVILLVVFAWKVVFGNRRLR